MPTYFILANKLPITLPCVSGSMETVISTSFTESVGIVSISLQGVFGLTE